MAIAPIDRLRRRQSDEKARQKAEERANISNQRKLLRHLLRYIAVENIEAVVEAAIMKSLADGKNVAWVHFDDEALFGKQLLETAENKYGVKNRQGGNYCTALAYRRLRRAGSFNEEFKVELVRSEAHTMCFGKRRCVNIKISW